MHTGGTPVHSSPQMFTKFRIRVQHSKARESHLRMQTPGLSREGTPRGPRGFSSVEQGVPSGGCPQTQPWSSRSPTLRDERELSCNLTPLFYDEETESQADKEVACWGEVGSHAPPSLGAVRRPGTCQQVAVWCRLASCLLLSPECSLSSSGFASFLSLTFPVSMALSFSFSILPSPPMFPPGSPGAWVAV